MKKYWIVQWKRVLRYLPGAVCVVLILACGLLLGLRGVTDLLAGSADNRKVEVAICGDVDDPILKLGLATISALDQTQYSIEMVIRTPEEAARMLEQGDIAAFVEVPEGFMDHAMSGQLIPLKMVTTAGSASLVSIFKDEVTRVIVTMVVESQKGVFGMMDGFREFGTDYQQELVDRLAFEYVDFILCRGEAYTLEEMGIADDLSFSEYLLCGLAVLLTALACLPFGPVMIQKDHALSRMLHCKGKPIWMQAVCSYGTYFLGLAAVFAVVILLAGALVPKDLADVEWGSVALHLLPVLVTVSAVSFLLWSLASDLISGLLLQFFAMAAMCFVSGCMYPVYFFPERIQKLASWLPTGMARTHLSGIFTGNIHGINLLAMILVSVICVALSAVIRTHNGRKEGL